MSSTRHLKAFAEFKKAFWLKSRAWKFIVFIGLSFDFRFHLSVDALQESRQECSLNVRHRQQKVEQALPALASVYHKLTIIEKRKILSTSANSFA